MKGVISTGCLPGECYVISCWSWYLICCCWLGFGFFVFSCIIFFVCLHNSSSSSSFLTTKEQKEKKPHFDWSERTQIRKNVLCKPEGTILFACVYSIVKVWPKMTHEVLNDFLRAVNFGLCAFAAVTLCEVNTQAVMRPQRVKLYCACN